MFGIWMLAALYGQNRVFNMFIEVVQNPKITIMRISG